MTSPHMRAKATRLLLDRLPVVTPTHARRLDLLETLRSVPEDKRGEVHSVLEALIGRHLGGVASEAADSDTEALAEAARLVLIASREVWSAQGPDEPR
jgi:hypothetical protein